MKGTLEPTLNKFEKITLYETSQLFYLFGSDEQETQFRVLKIDRRIVKPKSLDAILREDPLLYSRQDVLDLLAMINDGNRTTGGLVKVCSAFALIGFVKFLDCYYINLVTQRKLAGTIGSNNIYSIKATEIIPIKPRDESDSNSFRKLWSRLNKKINQTSADIAESRYMGLFQFIDMTKDFFFSYSYDITRTLQHNYIMCMKRAYPPPPSQEMFEWNYYQTEELKAIVQSTEWITPMVQGSFQHRKFSWFGKILDMVLIARRSRHYAGTRYLKRGISVHGKVANDCEVEQIMQIDVGQHAQYCCYVQVRGSIPTYWYQETSVTMPKPPILLNRRDPSYLASKEHFSDLFHRYSAPIVVLDLVKQEERKPRESLVGKEYRDLIDELNNSMPLLKDQIRYCALDYSRITKSSKHKNSHQKQSASAMSGVGQEWAMIESSLGSASMDNDGLRSQRPVDGSGQSTYCRTESSAVVTTNQSSTTGALAAMTNLGGVAMAAVGGGLTFASSSAGLGAQPGLTTAVPLEVKVDVLSELESISSMTLGETGIFCTKTEYLDCIGLLDNVHISAAKQRGYMEQRGVLRTNCIDCLDRTNVAQFAMGIRFLAVALRSLGLSNNLILDPTSPILMATMDMFSEMGDRIALQYGGSEAHKKVASNKASKNGELLTSIKRYYSNAFTDMVKQDAMNVFLGFYVPNEKITPLWDLESDYFLHNKSLRPPMPLENKILFNELKRKEFGGNSAYRYRRGMLVEGQGHSDAEEVLKLLQEAPRVGVQQVLRQYFFKAGVSESNLPAAVIAAIERSEKRKYVAAIINDRVTEAVEMWWKDSLQQFYSERQWMCLPVPSGMKECSYYERSHRPHELTFFDSVFSPTDGAITIDDATAKDDQFTMMSNKGDNSEEVRAESGDDEDNQKIDKETPVTSFGMISSVLFGRTDDGRHKLNMNSSAAVPATTISNIHESVDDLTALGGDTDPSENFTVSGFFVRKYLRDKVRAVVGVFAKKDEDSSTEAKSQQGSKLPRHSNITGQFNWGTQTLSKPEVILSAKTAHLYKTYADSWQDNVLLNSTAISITREDDFKQSLQELSVNVDSVSAMEHLSQESHISRVVTQGMYKGMNQNDSAIDANVFLFTTLLNVENELINCLDEEYITNTHQASVIPEAYANSSKESHMKAPVSQRAALMNQKPLSYDSSIRIPESTRARIFDACVKRKSGFGIESKLQASAARYLFQQVVYARDISISRLSCRLSSLTTEKTILDYALTFEKESLAANLDTITFIATGGPSQQTFTDLENLVDALTPQHDLYVTKVVAYIEEAKTNNKSCSEESNAKLLLDSTIVSEEMASIALANHNEYPGFKCLSFDLYEKYCNPFLHMNETAVKSYDKVFARMNNFG